MRAVEYIYLMQASLLCSYTFVPIITIYYDSSNYMSTKYMFIGFMSIKYMFTKYMSSGVICLLFMKLRKQKEINMNT